MNRGQEGDRHEIAPETARNGLLGLIQKSEDDEIAQERAKKASLLGDVRGRLRESLIPATLLSFFCYQDFVNHEQCDWFVSSQSLSDHT
jgi:hypothetical protein